jgi:hypothetical protein
VNLQNWINQAESHWKEHQPKLYQMHKKQRTLKLALNQAAEKTMIEVSELESQGYQPDEAFQMVREKYLFPPQESSEASRPESQSIEMYQQAIEMKQRMMELDQPVISQ